MAGPDIRVRMLRIDINTSRPVSCPAEVDTVFAIFKEKVE